LSEDGVGIAKMRLYLRVKILHEERKDNGVGEKETNEGYRKEGIDTGKIRS